MKVNFRSLVEEYLSGIQKHVYYKISNSQPVCPPGPVGKDDRQNQERDGRLLLSVTQVRVTEASSAARVQPTFSVFTVPAINRHEVAGISDKTT